MKSFLLMTSGFLLVMLMVSGLLLLQDIRARETMAARIRMIHGEGGTSVPGSQGDAMRDTMTGVASAVGTLLLRSGLIPAGTRTELELMLASSGLRGHQGLHVFLGFKLFSPLFMLIIGLFVTNYFESLRGLKILILPAFFIVGLIMPDWVIGKRRKNYLKRVEQGLPDALDLMVICTESGLGLGSAVVRVAEEMRHSYRELSLEFALTATEFQIMTDNRQALLNLSQRTNIESFKRFTTTLIQTLQYGTPVSQALRALSAELREEILTKFEEKAARLPVAITGPMIVFILPAVFIVAAGPAFLQVSRVFGH